MNIDNINDAPDILLEFLDYHSTIKGHSDNTIEAYYLDLKILFKFLKKKRGLVPPGTDFFDIDITDVDVDFIKTIKIEELYRYQSFSPDLIGSAKGLSASSRCRRTSSVKSFFKYLCVKRHLIDRDISQELDMPKIQKSLPKYLEERDCIKLLESCEGKFKERDYCIIMIFLSCGLRVSELCSLNITDIHEDYLRVIGKGNKERVVYFGDGCREAIDDYLSVRELINTENPDDAKALFLNKNGGRISTRGVEKMLDKTLIKAGLDADKFSPHKLRHTAATLMLKNGVETRALQEVLGHSNLNTTQIYTHLDNQLLREAAFANPIGNMKKEQ